MLATTGPINEDKGLEAPPAKDDDPDGIKLLSAPDGLDRAAKILQPLMNLAQNNVDTWITIYDVAIRRSEQTHSEFRIITLT
jgi:peptide alpha-N-acetyltransferase